MRPIVSTDPSQEPLPEAFGPYRVASRIATGGMAEVFLAHMDDGTPVAVKIIKPQYAGQAGFRQMFADEAKMSARLRHPNVVHVVDFFEGAEAEPPYLVMEYIDGPDLRKIIWESATRQLWIPIDLGAAAIAYAARGLHHAHIATDDGGQPLGLIHRDLSPQNIMVNSQGAVKVVDFGIAKAAGRNTRTQAGVIKGKYAYMSPEQVRGLPLDPRTDVFSLGILLYELLTYVNPFRHEQDNDTLIAVTDRSPKPPSERRPDIPVNLELVMLRALEKNRAARYQTALEFAEAIEATVKNRRRPVKAAHLADYIRGLDALPDEIAPMPPPEPVKELDEATFQSKRTEMGLPAFTDPSVIAERERQVAAASSSAAAPSPVPVQVAHTPPTQHRVPASTARRAGSGSNTWKIVAVVLALVGAGLGIGAGAAWWQKQKTPAAEVSP